MQKGLDYIFNDCTRIIIMGTFPSEKSRNKCYYNNPQNQFWKIIAHIFNNEDVINGSTEKRYSCLLNNGIGLWDVVHNCNIKGSCDKDIGMPEYNDFSIIKQKCSNIKCIVFNGKNAKEMFDDYLEQEKNEDLKNWLLELTNNGNNFLPSTSSANTRKKLEEKLVEWKNFIIFHLAKEN